MKHPSAGGASGVVTDQIGDHLLSQSFAADDVAMVRRLVARHAHEAGLAEMRRQDFVLAVDEIVTNAVRHGGGAGHLDVWIADGRLWFQVTDRGPGLRNEPATSPPSPTQVSGRGLWLARQITDDMTITSNRSGTVVIGAIAYDGTQNRP